MLWCFRNNVTGTASRRKGVGNALSPMVMVGLYVIRAFHSPAKLKLHNDVAGFIFATIGVTYAVLLPLSSSSPGRISMRCESSFA
jgi:hypothetical protein